MWLRKYTDLHIRNKNTWNDWIWEDKHPEEAKVLKEERHRKALEAKAALEAKKKTDEVDA